MAAVDTVGAMLAVEETRVAAEACFRAEALLLGSPPSRWGDLAAWLVAMALLCKVRARVAMALTLVQVSVVVVNTVEAGT